VDRHRNIRNPLFGVEGLTVKPLTLILLLSTSVACSSERAADAPDSSSSPITSDAGPTANDAAAPDPQVRVTLTEMRRAGNRPLADATVSVEQNGKIVRSGAADADGSWEADVDWDLGPVNVTAWRAGFTTTTLVGLTKEDIAERDEPLLIQMRSLTPPPSVQIEGDIATPAGQPIIRLSSDANLRRPTNGESVLHWAVATEPDLPVEIAYQTELLTRPVEQPGDGSGYQAYQSSVLDWWRISIEKPVAGLVFSEDKPSSNMRRIKPRKYRIALPRPVVGEEPSTVHGRTHLATPQGSLIVGRSTDANYEGDRFVLTMNTTDEVASAESAITELSRSKTGYQSSIWIDEPGKDIELTAVNWLEPPTMERADARGIAWLSDKSAYTTIFVAPANPAVAQWFVYVPAGVSEIEWPKLPADGEALLTGEVGAFLYSCEQHADGHCLRSATGEDFGFARGP